MYLLCKIKCCKFDNIINLHGYQYKNANAGYKELTGKKENQYI